MAMDRSSTERGCLRAAKACPIEPCEPRPRFPRQTTTQPSGNCVSDCCESSSSANKSAANPSNREPARRIVNRIQGLCLFACLGFAAPLSGQTPGPPPPLGDPVSRAESAMRDSSMAFGSSGGRYLARQTPHPAVVRVVAPGSGSISHGSGCLVAVNEQHGLVITNWHVINEATGTITVEFPDGFESSATVQKFDRDWDLAALVIWRPSVAPATLASHAPQPGDPLTIAGYGSGKYRAASGQCTQYVAPGLKFPYEMVEVSVAARQGDSGGPIFNSRGELAGVLFGAGEGRTSGSYCGRVHWFLNSVVGRRDSPANVAAVVSAPSSNPPGSTARAGQSIAALRALTASMAPNQQESFATVERDPFLATRAAGDVAKFDTPASARIQRRLIRLPTKGQSRRRSMPRNGARLQSRTVSLKNPTRRRISRRRRRRWPSGLQMRARGPTKNCRLSGEQTKNPMRR